MTLTLETPEKEKPPNCSIVTTSNIMASTISNPSSSTLIGDYIGVESCLDLTNHEDVFTSPLSSKKEEEEETHQSCYSLQACAKRKQRWAMKEFPPPIPLLARTENLASHMPWVLKRYYTSDGRLILREERVKHHEYFRAHRSEGRLTLQLVPLDNDLLASPFTHDGDHNENELECYCKEEEEEVEEVEEEGIVENEDIEVNERGDGVKSDDWDNGVDGNKIIEEEVVCEDVRMLERDEFVNDVESNEIIEERVVYADPRVPGMEIGIVGIGGGNGSAGKCLNYNSVRTSPTCIFGLPMPAMRPVHS